MKIHLQPKQRQLLDLLYDTGPKVATVIGGGGAKGGGKSGAARGIAIALGAKLGNSYPGIVITIVRRVAADLRDNHIQPLFRERPELERYWRATDHDLVMQNGARIIFRSAETEEDVRKRFLGGFESAIIIVDEAQQFSGIELQWIQTAARWTGREGIPEGLAKTLLLFNPGGDGADYLRRVFWTKDYEGGEKAHSFAFVHIFGWDNYEWFRGQVDVTEADFYQLTSEERFNLFITETSEGRKYDAFPPSIRAGYLLGSFDHFEGQYFAGAWDSKLNMLSTPTVSRLIQPWWTHWMATDWGWAGPPKPHYSVNLWAAIGKLKPSVLEEALGIYSDYPQDVMIVYRELHACLMPEPQWAEFIVDSTPMGERSAIQRHFIDGSVFDIDRKRPENSIADLMKPILEEAGFPPMERANKDRPGGWRQLYNGFLRASIARRSSPERPLTEELDGPLCLVSAECPELARSIPQLVCDPDKPADVLKVEHIKDDYGDTVRYLYKSMQDAQWQAPLEVRRREVYDSYDAPARSGPQMTALAMAMRRFDSEERKRYVRVKRRR